MINQVNKKIIQIIPSSDEKALNYLKDIQEKFDLKNIGFTLTNMIIILRNIRDDINFCAMEYPYANEIIGVIIESLFYKEGSICCMIEEYLYQKGLDVKLNFYYFLIFFSKLNLKNFFKK